MICPHCLRTIDDGTTFCPYCHGYVGMTGPSPRESFIFCEGCGAKLSPHDRVCPKCGRPAPGILSTKSASPDLAAGKTASFPRLTRDQLKLKDPELSHDALSASRVAVDSVDPFATTVLRGEDLEAASRRAERPAAPAPDGSDPYHKPRNRFIRPLLTVILLAALAEGGYWFVTHDPLGVMPSIEAYVREQAREMFPSRVAQGSTASADVADAAAREAEKAKQAQSSVVLTDAQAYQRLTAAYKSIVQEHDGLSDIIDAYNASFLASDLTERKEAAQAAYTARDAIDTTVSELSSLKLADGSAYTTEVQNLIQLAQWVRVRVDMYCASWDISLSYTDRSDPPSSHQREILQPLYDRDEQDSAARDDYFAHVAEYEPQPLS